MMPTLGMGAGQATEVCIRLLHQIPNLKEITNKDAYVLSAVLAHPQAPSHPEAALTAYSRVRRDFVNSVARTALRNALYSSLRDESYRHFDLVEDLEPESVSKLQNGHAKHNGLNKNVIDQVGERITLSEVAQQIKRSFEWVDTGAESEPGRATAIFEKYIAGK
jgi:hypothetical protein